MKYRHYKLVGILLLMLSVSSMMTPQGIYASPVPAVNTIVTTPLQQTNDQSTLESIVTFALAVGANHTCVLSGSNNTPMCWGENTFGQLGNNATTNSNLPVYVIIPVIPQ